MSNDEILREFLLETHENLALLDADLLRLEQQPTDAATLAQAFRTLHSVKGTAGFMGLDKLQAISHSAESLLAKLRSGTLLFNRPIATALLKVVDAIREILAHLEQDGTEGSGQYTAISAEVDFLQTGQVPEQDRTEPVSTDADASDPSRTVTTFDSHRTKTSIGEMTLPYLPPIAPEEPSQPTSAPVVPVPPVVPVATSPMPGAAHEPPAISSSSATTPMSAALTSSTVADTSIRVDVDLVDQLMTLVGELVLARNHILQVSAGMEHDGLTNAVQRLSRLTTDLQSSVMKTRMQPIANVLNKFPRIVRDLSLAVGKKVQFDVGGHDTELDRSLLEAIRDPLTHMIRNAIDHGIEDPDTRVAAGKSPAG
ncbi:MAG: chemotaxis protein CheA, partial [Planctomycetota bacterium]